MRRLFSVLLVLLVSSSANALTVDDAINYALSKAHGNVALRALRERVESARDTARSARARMLFSLHATDQYQHYNCPFAVSFTTFQAACQDDLAAMAGSGAAAAMPPFVLRNEDTNLFSVSLDQPLLGLLRLGQDYTVQRHNADSLAENLNAEDAKLVETIRNGFLRYFEAVAAEAVAKDSESELAEQVQIALVREKNGVITIADRLRVQVALANAHQQRVAGHAEAEIARSSLLDTIGLPIGDDSIQLEEPRQLLVEAAQPVPNRAVATRDAENRRPEIRQAKQAWAAAAAAHRSRVLAMLPDVDFQANFTHVDGQIFLPTDSWYAGVTLDWTFWAWGADYFAQRAAKHQQTAAELAVEGQQRQVAVEVRTAFSNLDAATAAVQAAKEAIDSAEEAYRVTAKLVQAGTATTTDLLNAQSELTTARLNLSRSRYQQAMARVTLRRLTGD